MKNNAIYRYLITPRNLLSCYVLGLEFGKINEIRSMVIVLNQMDEFCYTYTVIPNCHVYLFTIGIYTNALLK